MCARRFLMVVFFITLLAVAAAFAIFQFGDRVLIKSAVPTGHFQAAEGGGDPDYSKAENWVARPDLPTDPSHWLPAGMSEEHLGNAAVFYIHPTTYLERDRWNAPLQAGGDTDSEPTSSSRARRALSTVLGEVWAPRYRQAAFGAFLLNSADATKALDLAYSDVSAGIRPVPEEAGDRPIILAGHSQGALHLERLIKEKIAGKPIARRLSRPTWWGGRSARSRTWPGSRHAALPKRRSDWLHIVVAEFR